MTSPLDALITRLSEKDSKTLIERALELSSHAGALGRLALGHETVPGFEHRIMDKEQLLLACAALLVTARSLLASLGVSEEELTRAMECRALEAQRLLDRERQIARPLPFEIHVTVASAERDAFVAACAALSVKPIFLALQSRSEAQVLKDVMTSSTFFGDNTDALAELKRIADGLTEAGFTVLRRKIETAPWHPAAPSESSGVREMPPGGYFESHLNVLIEAPDEAAAQRQRELLRALATRHQAHLSRNIFKEVSARAFTTMLTLRTYEGTRESFEHSRDALAADLKAAGFVLEKLITEFALYDSKIEHDSAWLKAS